MSTLLAATPSPCSRPECIGSRSKLVVVKITETTDLDLTIDVAAQKRSR
jgi:hypothetical protein